MIINLLKNMVLKFEFELFIFDDFRKVSKSKIGVPLRVPFWAGVRLNIYPPDPRPQTPDTTSGERANGGGGRRNGECA